MMSGCLRVSLRRRLLSTRAAPASVAIARNAAQVQDIPLDSTPPKPPKSVYSIPVKAADSIQDAGAVIRQVGTSRRVFLLKPYLTPTEIEGLAYRIRTLTRNEGLSSVLIATNDEDDLQRGALPASARDFDLDHDVDVVDYKFPNLEQVWFVSGGYDPLEVYKTRMYKDPDAVNQLLSSVQQLAMATRGHTQDTRVPVITIPHGLISDAGYALCMGSYAIATPQTCFRIQNPSRGLSFDPVGFSYILPRLGWELDLPVSDYPGAGLLLALASLEANAEDMVETGLATHYMDSVNTLGYLERALAETVPWNQQGILKKPKRYYGHNEQKEDVNAPYRNVQVAELMHACTTYHASGLDVLRRQRKVDEEYENLFEQNDDPSLDLDPVPWREDRESDLVNYAATFEQIFKNENSVYGLLERFREIAARRTENEEEQEGIDLAADIVQRMERQSPLALRVVFRLMQLGSKQMETLESCMEREKLVQTRMMTMPDFVNWAEHCMKYKDSDTPPFTGWKHTSVKEITRDEVDEIMFGDSTLKK
jgi:enoyl-CoA hydratase/carnithine racemase